MLYDSSKEWISLQQELDYINNYLEIEKIRYGTRLDVSFTMYGVLEGLEVPPLVFLPFVENAFKHGLSRQTGKAWLRIEVSYDGTELTLKVENSHSEAALQKHAKGGMGIDNVRRRLGILMKDAFSIKQLEGKETYLVILSFQPKIAIHEQHRQQVDMPYHR